MDSPTCQTCHPAYSKQTLLILLMGVGILLIIPVGALLIGWQWDPAQANPTVLRLLYWVSESASALIALFFCAVLLVYLKLTPRKSLYLIAILLVIIAIGLGIKSATKNSVRESRPYVVWLEKNNFIAPGQFYQLPHKSRFVSEQVLPRDQVPQWQQQYWSQNTGYSFPSGHSFFAAIWPLIVAALLWRQKAYITITLTMVWAWAVLVSRMYLGMHWPQDLIPSCLLAFILVWIGSLCWNKWVLQSNPELAAPPSQ